MCFFLKQRINYANSFYCDHFNLHYFCAFYGILFLMATITCLPDEIIAIILGYSDVTIEDVTNFRCVCKQFCTAAKYDKFRQKKFFQRWHLAKEQYDKQYKRNEQKESVDSVQKDKGSLNFIETGINCVRQIQKYVFQEIHEPYFPTDSINNYKEFNPLLRKPLSYFCKIIYLQNNSIEFCFLIDEIKSLLTQCPRKTGCNLTERYHLTKLLHEMRQSSLQLEFNTILHQPRKKQLMERTATIFAQALQLQKELFYSYVETSLDRIAQKTLNCLKEKHPNHSIFSTSAETFSYWRNNDIDNNYWNEAEGIQILDTLDEYIFGKLNFRPCNSEDTAVKYMCIYNVLKNKYGQEIILLIIYHSVARRLGLYCKVRSVKICNISHYYIFWKPNYTTNNLENARCFNIICKQFPDCLINQLSLFRNRCRSYYTIEPITMWDELRELYVYLHNRYNTPFGFNQYIQPSCNIYKISLDFKKERQLNTRPEDVKYAVGMIVTHQQQCVQPTNSSTCAGVIVGWHRPGDTDVEFSLIGPCEEDDDGTLLFFYILLALPLIHCSNYEFRKRQTNYIILTENNNICYVEEDAIILQTTPKWIDNSEIGRYFCKFEKTHYLPNEILTRLYPHDAAITIQTNNKISKN